MTITQQELTEAYDVADSMEAATEQVLVDARETLDAYMEEVAPDSIAYYNAEDARQRIDAHLDTRL